MLLASIAVVGRLGMSAHQWMWEHVQLSSYRATMRDVATTLQATQLKAMAQRRTFELRIDASQHRVQLVSVVAKPGALLERVERTIWLPDGLEISEAPRVLRVGPLRGFSPSSIVIVAPAHNRLFRLQTSETGYVEWHEEPTL